MLSSWCQTTFLSSKSFHSIFLLVYAGRSCFSSLCSFVRFCICVVCNSVFVDVQTESESGTRRPFIASLLVSTFRHCIMTPHYERALVCHSGSRFCCSFFQCFCFAYVCICWLCFRSLWRLLSFWVVQHSLACCLILSSIIYRHASCRPFYSSLLARLISIFLVTVLLFCAFSGHPFFSRMCVWA